MLRSHVKFFLWVETAVYAMWLVFELAALDCLKESRRETMKQMVWYSFILLPLSQPFSATSFSTDISRFDTSKVVTMVRFLFVLFVLLKIEKMRKRRSTYLNWIFPFCRCAFNRFIWQAEMFRKATRFTGQGHEGGIKRWNVANVRNFYGYVKRSQEWLGCTNKTD